MSLNASDIERLIDEIRDGDIVQILTIFRDAMNDWPTPVSTVEEYVDQIEQRLEAPAAKSSLEQFSKKCSFQKDAWNAESIAGVLEVYRYRDCNLSLPEIVADLERKLANN